MPGGGKTLATLFFQGVNDFLQHSLTTKGGKKAETAGGWAGRSPPIPES